MERSVLKEIPLLEQVSANKEKVVIPNVGDFFILTPKEGRSINVENVIEKEHYTGPTEFAFIVASSVYGPLRQEVPIGQRWSSENGPREVQVLVHDELLRRHTLRNLSLMGQVAHFYSGPGWEKNARKFWTEKYLEVAGWVWRDLRLLTSPSKEEEVIIPLDQAGQRLADGLKINYPLSLEINRFGIEGEDSILATGITPATFKLIDRGLEGKNIIALAPIQATGARMINFLFALREAGIRPRSLKAVALVGVQPGVELYLKAAKHFGWETEVHLAGLGFNLNREWEATASSEDELSRMIQFQVGEKPLNQIHLVGETENIIK